MNISGLVTNVIKHARANSPEILTALGVTGTVTTAYLTGKAAFKAGAIVYSHESKYGACDNRVERFKERAKLTWRLYVPAAVTGTSTVVCIVGASRASGHRTAAAVTAFSVTEKAFSEYKEKVVEQIGKNQEQKIRDGLAQDKVKEDASKKEILIAGTGHVLCCELYTRRYFRSDMETLRKAQNDINSRIVNDVYVSLDEFYDLLGLSYTSVSHKLGWTSDKLMSLEFSTVLSDNGEPCLAFDYNYVKPL